MRVQRQDIIDAAMALLDDGGVDGLTMRRLAAALRIQAPSLYWHFAGKQALLDAMADALLAEMVLPEEEMPWDGWLRAVATEFRRALKSRRDGARVFAGTFPALDNVLRISDRIIAKLRAAGADERLAVRTLFTVQYFVLGFTIEEQAATPPPGGHGHEEGEGVDLMQVAQRLTAEQAARYPNAAITVKLLASDDDDARFRFGLDRLIDGLKAVMPS
ncbi:TetR/AcrR family transcriptional regulator C-terminal domain-containing protein [Azospirillum sp. YIM B02556]|uniref:TetR/AcrR family transcriptional regulator C-terminal domain-containing protein n=1 Tax=Azospirillum endophyticum TaxID=2800326 RepID=A0ABS1F6R3_9PROT|nr:TetR/AcrR family transcriptional regulator C-terminal domain-containing protein [Azospirillum endophyticum]MBK1839135.1 TetR/AcrR family transcriptional regulator C-terminal domain-containing protein [Azospirillum endophyticum]